MNLPNKLTVLRMVAVPFFIICYILDFNFASLLIFILASITDMLDGKIARKRNLVTNFGKIMDPLADKILVYSAFCLMIPSYVKSWMLIIILAREFIISGMRTVAASNGIVIQAGFSGKIKTVLQMVTVPAFLLFKMLPECWPIYILGCLMLYASLIMTIYSGIEYVVKNKNVFKN